MKRVKLMTLLGCISAQIIWSVCAFAEDNTYTFTDVKVFPMNAMNRLPSVSLGAEENTITVKLDKTSRENEEYYISVYERGDNAFYAVKYLGPIDISGFSITGLNNNRDYHILLSSTSNMAVVSGMITTSYTEEEA